MDVILNGSAIVTPVSTLAQLIEERAVDTTGIAVAIGSRVIPRALWAETALEPGCTITIIRATQGG